MLITKDDFRSWTYNYWNIRKDILKAVIHNDTRKVERLVRCNGCTCNLSTAESEAKGLWVPHHPCG
jgi:hypothetical protein